MLDCQCHLHMLQRDNAMQGSIALAHGSVKPQKVVCSDFFVVADCLFRDYNLMIFIEAINLLAIKELMMTKSIVRILGYVVH